MRFEIQSNENKYFNARKRLNCLSAGKRASESSDKQAKKNS